MLSLLFLCFISTKQRKNLLKLCFAPRKQSFIQFALAKRDKSCTFAGLIAEPKGSKRN